MSVRSYVLGVNWSRGPDYTGVLEDATSYVAKVENIVITWGRSDIWTSSDTAVSKMTYKLLNNTRYFSPENTSSPIAGKQVAGTPSKLDYAGTNIYTGILDIPEVTTTGTDKMFGASVIDSWARLGDTMLSTDVQKGQRTGDLINTILTLVGWPVGSRSIDAGATLIPYWWAENQTARDAVDDLIKSEGEPAIFYIRQGVATFRDRHHRVTRTASLTSQGIHAHTIPATAPTVNHKILKGSFSYSHGLDRIINSATLEVTPRLPTVEGVVWSLDDAIIMGASEVRTVIIQANDPFINMQVPDATTVYITGSGRTVDYTLTSGSIGFALSRTSGQSATLTMTAGAGGAVIYGGLRIRATPLPGGSTQKFTTSDTGSIAQYGTAEWQEPDAPWAYYYDAQAIIALQVGNYAQPRPSVSFDIEGRIATATQTRIVAADISDRITVRNDEMGLNADFHIEQLQHVVQQLGVKHTLTIGAQVVAGIQAQNAFQFDVAAHGFDQGQFAAFAGNNPNTMFRFDTAGVGFDQGVFAT